MSLAICIKCGALKKGPPQRCLACRFQPRSDVDKAKSIILSLDYELEDEYRGMTREHLLALVPSVRAGTYQFDEAQVQEIISYAKQVLSVPKKTILIDLAKWLGPPLLLLFLVYAALVLFR